MALNQEATNFDTVLTIANDRIRSAAKWLIASSAAVGAALIAGSQLSSIGLANGERFVTALVGAVLALGGVIVAIWRAVLLLLPKTVLIGELRDAWTAPQGDLKRVVAFFKGNPEHLQGYMSPAQAIEKRDKYVRDWQALETSDIPGSGKWWRRRSSRRQSDEHEAAIANAKNRVDDVDARIEAIEQEAQHEALLAQFHHLLRWLLLTTLLVGAGIVMFAWGANPPPKESSADLRGAQLVDAYLRDVDLRNAKLDNANLTGADLLGADLTGASIANVTWGDTICPDGTNSDNNKGTCAGHLKP